VTTHTKRYTRCFWALDATRAQARFYPAIHPLLSYSQDSDVLADFWNQQGNPQWSEQRRRFLTLLEEQSKLERMARIVGKDALPPRQQNVLLSAELVNEAFLRQSAFSPIDRYCSPARQIAMMRVIMRFIELSESAVAEGVSVERINDLPVMRKIRRMGEDIGEDQLDEYKELMRSLEAEFTHLTEGVLSNAR
jgi:V/A-type H+-transporting ATPase subunit A